MAWTQDTPLKIISLKAILFEPALSLQKPSQTLKYRDHFNVFWRRLLLWEKEVIRK